MSGAEMRQLGRAAAVESYRLTRESGQLSRMHRLIWDAIAAHGPMTGTETYQAIERDHDLALHGNTRTRFGEMRDRGLLVEAGLRSCSVTGRRAIVWALGEGEPVERPERPRCEACGRPLPRARAEEVV